ncbi:hypothetical protein LCGC14_1362450 [marine sediment metagenome]|uniref:Uncharacterized protein n=1 Tax=marine sediment metagenome TaxID=412755 RepID=A0A0F9K8B2_9ZZZZ
MECPHGFKELRRRVFLSGGVMFGKQCLRCGWLVGNWIRGEQAVAFLLRHTFHDWDIELRSTYLDVARGAARGQ